LAARFRHISVNRLNGTPPLAPGEEGLRDMRAVDAIFASVSSGNRERVPQA
jgi:glucose-fructose oxidoreductase